MGRDPFKDWAIIILITCVISFVFVVMGVSSYHDVDSAISLSPVASGSDKLPFEVSALDNAVKELDLRASNQKSIINANIPLAPL